MGKRLDKIKKAFNKMIEAGRPNRTKIIEFIIRGENDKLLAFFNNPKNRTEYVNQIYGDSSFLGHAILNNNIEAANILLRSGADPNLKIKGVSPIEIAVVSRDIEMTRLLLNNNANPNLVTGDVMRWGTLVSIAVNNGDAAMVDFLLKNGADVNTSFAMAKFDAETATSLDPIESAIESYHRHLGIAGREETCHAMKTIINSLLEEYSKTMSDKRFERFQQFVNGLTKSLTDHPRLEGQAWVRVFDKFKDFKNECIKISIRDRLISKLRWGPTRAAWAEGVIKGGMMLERGFAFSADMHPDEMLKIMVKELGKVNSSTFVQKLFSSINQGQISQDLAREFLETLKANPGLDKEVKAKVNFVLESVNSLVARAPDRLASAALAGAGAGAGSSGVEVAGAGARKLTALEESAFVKSSGAEKSTGAASGTVTTTSQEAYNPRQDIEAQKRALAYMAANERRKLSEKEAQASRPKGASMNLGEAMFSDADVIERSLANRWQIRPEDFKDEDKERRASMLATKDVLTRKNIPEEIIDRYISGLQKGGKLVSLQKAAREIYKNNFGYSDIVINDFVNNYMGKVNKETEAGYKITEVAEIHLKAAELAAKTRVASHGLAGVRAELDTSTALRAPSALPKSGSDKKSRGV